MSSLNKVILIGNLGADPEVRTFQNGGKVANLRLATSESWKDRTTGERQERTEWHSVTLHGDGLVGIADRYLHKGSKVCVEGQLRTRKWQDRDGADRYTTEVVLSGPRAGLTLLDGRRADGAHGATHADGSRSGGQPLDTRSASDPGPADWSADLDDDIPF